MAKGFALALLATLAVLPALGHASTRPAAGEATCPTTDVVVTIADYSFTPSQLNIGPGTTVCWTFPTGIASHTVTSDDGTSFNSGNLSAGQIYEHTFTAEGTFRYHCIYHGAAGAGMAGMIQVGAPPPPPPPPPPPAPPPPPPVKPPCSVPKVVGRSLANAKRRITRAHCRVGRITRRHSSARKKGKVIAQSPRAGRRLANRHRVNLVVGKG